ncbi:hypothetical protein ABCR94_34590 [Streptomyces sp. 21So2-11]|uniref:hypothetical protein n=1 Tax=Streptomyces sp. 21So2-11 TaxID=3144408 RepID=UPI00321BE053
MFRIRPSGVFLPDFELVYQIFARADIRTGEFLTSWMTFFWSRGFALARTSFSSFCAMCLGGFFRLPLRGEGARRLHPGP